MADALTSTSKLTPGQAPLPAATSDYKLDKTIVLDGDADETLSILTAIAVAPNVLNEVFEPEANFETILTITVRGITRAK